MQPEAPGLEDVIKRLMAGESLSRHDACKAMQQILENRPSALHQGAFLAAISLKGPEPDEIAGVWQAIQELDTVAVRPRTDRPLMDNCGTGMDEFKTFNISTAAAIVAAAAGIPMARHGARAITSRCGTVDLCEALGVNVTCPVETVSHSIETANIGLFNGMSTHVHPRALFRILAEMRFGSILNIAASLANPARPSLGVRGVYARAMVLPVAQTMRMIGFKRALVFHGRTSAGGMDELSPAGPNYVAELRADGSIHTDTLHPEDLGVCFNADIQSIAAGTSPQAEARRLRQLFNGKATGPLFETVALNAAPLFYIAGITPDLASGLRTARHTITSGKALACLETWIQSQQIQARPGRPSSVED